MMKKTCLVVTLFTILQLAASRGQKPGQMNEYDPESNTVFDEAPEEETWHNWFTDLIFTEETKHKYGRNHGSVNAQDKHGGSLWSEIWEDLKIGAKITLTLLVLAVFALVGYVGYTVYRKRKEAQNKKWYQFNR